MCPTKQKQKHHHHHHSHRSSTTVAAAEGQGAGVEDWRQEAINGGSLKHVDLHTGSNGWASPPGDVFSLRGPNYLTKKTKVPSGPWLLQPAGVDWLRSNAKLDHVLARPDNRVMNSLKSSNLQGKSLKTFLVAVNLQVPGRDHHSAVFYFATKEGEGLQPGSLLYRFVHGDDNFRNSRFKIVNRIVKGPWIVKAAVGNYAACLLGKALKCNYFVGDNYLEIDVDIGSSAIASAILHLALGYVTAVTIDMGFLVEAQSEDELPEKLFGAVRICQMEMSSATYVENSSNAVSFKRGLHSGHPNGSNSNSSCSKSKVQAEEGSNNGME
ncbi:protein ENHANCED DISEASE RESISTANCE 2-like [Coffea arabica]|uniref:Protein ENHANCED DISEASE RESISTANCE 2-like n=1 Tax=Coffea arabica TaxID=13443 RepID=A0A6P6TYC2_COFAR|nr:protein ENHANCED DISEASE RESISTANCE 2-like [Coffea arabica]